MASKKIAKSIALATVSAFPYIGGPLATLISEMLKATWQERREQFEKEVNDKFSKLDSDIEEKLRQSQNFASVFVSIGQNALTDIESDKVQLYVSAMINSIKNEKITDTKIHIFLNILREFTLAHIDLLKRLSKEIHAEPHKPQQVIRTRQRTQQEVNIEDFFNDFEPKELLENLLEDLYRYKLVDDGTQGIGIAFNGQRIHPKRTTKLGDEFLGFITEHE